MKFISLGGLWTALVVPYSCIDAFPTIPSHRGFRGNLASCLGCTSVKNNNWSANQDRDQISCPPIEIFSVAPMMAHTNRHFHYYFQCFSQYATLYTEMIPANQIVAAYRQQASRRRHFSSSTPSSLSLDEIPFVTSPNDKIPLVESPLDALLQLSAPNALRNGKNPVVLQLGGRDPQILAFAAAIGTYYGYDGVNLNCGCPSNAVSSGDRSGGAALMREPEHVARCVEAMSKAISLASTAQSLTRIPELSVKHRLGIHDAATYDAKGDRQKDDAESYLQCREFVRLISKGSHVSKIQVHARLGLLGDFEPPKNDDLDSLWVPGKAEASVSGFKKIDHKRLQYRAKQRARQATIKNRDVPPLRPGVVDLLAQEFPGLDVITNGGIRSMDDIEGRLCLKTDTEGRNRMLAGSRNTSVIGAMIGRAVINHPCSFANVDKLWGLNQIYDSAPTREEVLMDYIRYCREEEEVFRLQFPSKSLEALRRRLVAVPFHLFVGEVGNEEYQRRIRKLISRPERHTSSGVLKAALAEVPAETATKSIIEYTTDIGNIPVYSSSNKRSGPIQRTIS